MGIHLFPSKLTDPDLSEERQGFLYYKEYDEREGHDGKQRQQPYK